MRFLSACFFLLLVWPGNIFSQVYQGFVCDSISKRPLSGAVVSLLKNDTTLLSSQIIDSKVFFISMPHKDRLRKSKYLSWDTQPYGKGFRKIQRTIELSRPKIKPVRLFPEIIEVTLREPK